MKGTSGEAGKVWVKQAELMPSGCLRPIFPLPVITEGRRKEEQRPGTAAQEGISARASPAFNSSDTAVKQKVGPSGPRLLLSLPTPSLGFCAAQHWVSAGLMRDTHAPSLSNTSILSSPLPGAPCVHSGFWQKVSLSLFPPPWLPQDGQDKIKPPKKTHKNKTKP